MCAISADDVKAEFDSFICFEEEDSEFVKEMIYECETKAGLKLCLDARDLLAGHNEQYITAEMIKARYVLPTGSEGRGV